MAKQDKKPLDTQNVAIAVYLDSPLLHKWQREVSRIADPKKVSLLGRAALRHFLFKLNEEQRAALLEDEIVASAKDKVIARRRRPDQSDVDEVLDVGDEPDSEQRGRGKGRAG